MLVFANGENREEKTGPPPACATPDAKEQAPTMKRTLHHPLDVILDILMTRSQEQAS
jgi:hypothetical protein